jgi:asparagine synthase (glutamine-hydrolysing)
MCGVTGIYNLTSFSPITEALLRQMLGMIRYRGPDQFGVYRDEHVGLGSARLSIIDLGTGQQPICNEDGSLWIIFNGEIFNYVELRADLETRGHHFSTTSDTEVILHLYEEQGANCVNCLNGQFVFAIWDTKQRSLFIARDRLGIRPLFYTVADGQLIFGSEIKAILAHPAVHAELAPEALHQIFTFWSTLDPATAFKGIHQLPPGHHLTARDGDIKIAAYWQLQFGEEANGNRTEDDYLDELGELLIDATLIRLRADVPVGAYLSGGLDSSTTAAIIRNYTTNRLNTFSITFSDTAFDESVYQRQVADHLGTDHHIVHATHGSIGHVFPDVTWHTETPILRTAPAPMFLLSKLVREQGFKVVMTGEGADEFLAGYDIFKEDRIRRFWAKNPESQLRPLLLQRLYRDIGHLNTQRSGFMTTFFQQGLAETSRADYSHALRWRNTYRARRFFSKAVQAAAPDWEQQVKTSTLPGVRYPRDFQQWHPLHRAQYLEATTFLAPYLLSSQGDRVTMAHSVEGRYPFLDYRVVEFCNRLPPHLKLHGLTEKYLLKRLARRWIPDAIWQRNKRPYRAPIQASFFNQDTPAYVRELLSADCVAQAGYFNPAAVQQLVKQIDGGMTLGETDGMALVGILSTQLIHQQFITDFKISPPLTENDDVKVCGVASKE